MALGEPAEAVFQRGHVGAWSRGVIQTEFDAGWEGANGTPRSGDTMGKDRSRKVPRVSGQSRSLEWPVLHSVRRCSGEKEGLKQWVGAMHGGTPESLNLFYMC